MVTTRLKVSREQSRYLDYEIIVGDGNGRATCVEAHTGTVIGSVRIPAEVAAGRQPIDPNEMIRMIGGTYRLAKITVDIETNLLVRRTRRLSDIMRSHRRFWRRLARVQIQHLESDAAAVR
jgi:hypothetical protein